MLFPQLGPSYYDEKDKGMISRMEAFYSEAISINMSFWGEADTDVGNAMTSFESGRTASIDTIRYGAHG